MGTHPNVILAVALKPNSTSRKTMREILALHPEATDISNKIKIGSEEYHTLVMEDDYDEGWQIAADEGDLIFFDLVTYGYGETIEWLDLKYRKEELESWAIEMCNKFNCTYKIFITANYW